MNVEPIVLAMVSAMMLLDDTSAEEIDPDVAVRGQENMGYYLNLLSEGDRTAFREVLERIADAHAAQDPALASYIRGIPFSLGWDEEPPTDLS